MTNLSFKTKLYKHQEEAYQKLNQLKVGALYMEMGTGKTRAMLEIAADKLNNGKIDKIIWFCPCSAKINIKKEIEKHILSGHDSVIICGIESMSSSDKLRSYLLDYVDKYRCLVVVDESIKIKNHLAERTRWIKLIGKNCQYRYILNGTAITRDERDLFAQWNFLDWRILGYRSYYSFESNHVRYFKDKPMRVQLIENVDYLTRKIAPYSYQINKEECLDLPDKLYETQYFRLNSEQYENYMKVGDYLIDQLDDMKPSTIYRLFSNLQAICSGWNLKITNKKIEKVSYRSDISDNPRLSALNNLLDKYSEEKIIIYCEYKIEAEAIANLLRQKYGDCFRIYNGDISEKIRNKNIEEFENKVRFLVASKDCASYSLNLQFCHNVIYYNNDWDYGTRTQSEDRVHRIGQTHNVLYVDIIAESTVEERIWSNLMKKEKLIDWFTKELDKTKSKNIREIIYQSKTDQEAQIKIMEDLNENLQQ